MEKKKAGAYLGGSGARPEEVRFNSPHFPTRSLVRRKAPTPASNSVQVGLAVRLSGWPGALVPIAGPPPRGTERVVIAYSPDRCGKQWRVVFQNAAGRRSGLGSHYRQCDALDDAMRWAIWLSVGIEDSCVGGSWTYQSADP